MPYGYTLKAAPIAEEPWRTPASASTGGRGWRFWLAVGVATVLVLGGATIVGADVAGNSAPFTAGALAADYFPGSFEAVRLTTGDLVFAHVLSHNGSVELTDVYYVDPASGKLVQGQPGWLPQTGVPAEAAVGLFGRGAPLMVNPAQIVTVEPVSATSPVGRQIASTEAREQRQRIASTTTTKPLGFQ